MASTTKKGGFLVPMKELTGEEIMTRGGVFGARLATDLGMSYVGNIDYWQQHTGLRKALGPVTFLVGLAGEIMLNGKDNTLARIAQGAAQGLAIYGAKDMLFQWVMPGQKAAFGLAGLPQEENDGGTDWAAVLAAYNGDAGGGQIKDLSGVETVTDYTDIPLSGYARSDNPLSNMA